ncbi:hypothetical protein PHLCEN_2v362 [Hermanssonia centrifuga]|uniref:Uncharacterized protein n=1 Tax=Hermanssonia centrifuga TaxID=98765 RepID=A0A2R6S6B2_9APHY|nr:hypothetical protein PHLCEN_2v362 [Hermanssonia centrifuga]
MTETPRLKELGAKAAAKHAVLNVYEIRWRDSITQDGYHLGISTKVGHQANLRTRGLPGRL